jgi:hypothetical protein
MTPDVFSTRCRRTLTLRVKSVAGASVVSIVSFVSIVSVAVNDSKDVLMAVSLVVFPSLVAGYVSATASFRRTSCAPTM